MSEEEGFMLFWAGLSIIASMITAKLKSRVTFLQRVQIIEKVDYNFRKS